MLKRKQFYSLLSETEQGNVHFSHNLDQLNSKIYLTSHFKMQQKAS